MSEILTSPRSSRFGRAVGFRLAGIGAAVPPRVVTNADLSRLGCDPEWILARTGIRERRHADPDVATSDLAAAAGAAAIAHAGRATGDVDLLVLGTFTPDMCIPSTACITQEKIGLDAPAMDVTAACASFAYALVTAAQFVTAGSSTAPAPSPTPTPAWLTRRISRPGRCSATGRGPCCSSRASPIRRDVSTACFSLPSVPMAVGPGCSPAR